MLPNETTIGRASPHAVRADRIPAVIVWCCVPICAGLLLLNAGEGADFGHYSEWGAAALSGDIFTLSENVLSPAGVPYTLAAAGPGLLFAVSKLLLTFLPLTTAALLGGWIAAVAFWCCAFVVLRRAADGDEWLALFGAVVLFIGTHAGFYSHVYATEVFADALIAALWALMLTRTHWRPLDCLGAGVLAGLLLLVRAHVVIYAVPALWLAVFGQPTTPGGFAWPPIRSMATRLLITAFPLGIAIAEYATLNYWMTGSALHPPYVYGGAGFSSVDMRHPELAAVLVHPLHGLLSYHPLYAVAFAAIALLAWRGGRRGTADELDVIRGRLLWMATFLAVVAHVWVPAGWYIWWLGGGSFGMRGLAPAALPLVAGLVAFIRKEADKHRKRTRVLLWCTVLSCVWSYSLLLRGYSGFVTWAELIAAQRTAFAAMLVTAGVLSVGWLRRRREQAPMIELRLGTVAGALATVLYLGWQTSHTGVGSERLLIGAVASVSVLLLLHVAQRSAWAPNGVGGRFALIAAVAVFVTQAVLFTRLGISTYQHLASGTPPPRAFAYVGASPVDELRMTYREYAGIPGFERRKAAMRRFLQWQRMTVSPMSPRDREIAATVSLLLDGDAAFAGELTEVSVRDGVVLITANGMSDTQQSTARRLALIVPGVQSVTFSTN
jgi:hypothetical protein